MNFS
jgi:hypothetical protein